MSIKNIKIFISSPGDVGQERLLTRRTIERLQGEFKAYVTLEPILWEHEPLRATEHFQEQIVLPSSTDIVICILWSRLGTRLPEKFKKQDGSNYSSGTEWEFEDAAKAYSEKRIPDLLVYRKTENPPINMKDNTSLFTLEQKKALDIFLNKWFGNPQNGFEAAFHTFDELDEFETKLEVHLRKLIMNRIPTHLFKEEAALSWFSGSPYMGLEAFDIEHSSVFYGRTKDIGKIKEALSYQATMGCAFLMVLGKSGCGKSSLIRAGVIPNITQSGVIEGIEYWRQAYFRPGGTQNDIMQSFAMSLFQKEALDDNSDETAISNIIKSMKEDKEAFVGLIEKKLLKLRNQEKKSKGLVKLPETRFVVFIDQMEEIFTMEKITEAERKEFISVLSMLGRSGFVWIIATMRSDFYSRCTEIPELIAMKEGKGHYDLLPPTISEIGQIIRQPAKASGIKFEKNVKTGESLDEIILQTASSNTGILPLLEFTLDELYKKREGNILTFESYNKMGGLEGAIASKAEEVLEKLPQEISSSLPIVFRQLITIQTKDENIITSRMIQMDRDIWGESEHKLINEFIEARLLVTDNIGDGNASVSIAHEALIYNWPRLQNIINEDKDFLRIRARVTDSQERWEKENKNSDFLLPEGKPLFEADYLLKNKIREIEISLVTYIKESIKKSRRKKRNKILGISSAFAIIICFAIFSFSQWQIANAQTQLANNEKTRAETNAIEAEAQKQKAEANAKEALAQQQLAETNAKEAESQKQIAETNAKEALEQKQIAEEQTGIAKNKEALALLNEKKANIERDKVLLSKSQDDIDKYDKLKSISETLSVFDNIQGKFGDYGENLNEVDTLLNRAVFRSEFEPYAIIKDVQPIEKAYICSDGNHIVTNKIGENGTTNLWDIENGNSIDTNVCLDSSKPKENRKSYIDVDTNNLKAIRVNANGNKQENIDLDKQIIDSIKAKGNKYNNYKIDGIFDFIDIMSPDNSYHVLCEKNDINNGGCIMNIYYSSGNITSIKTGLMTVNDVSIMPDSKSIIVGTYQGNLVSYNSSTGEVINNFNNYDDINEILPIPNSKNFVTINKLYEIARIWNINSKDELKSYSNIDSVDINNNKFIMHSASNGYIYICNIESYYPYKENINSEAEVNIESKNKWLSDTDDSKNYYNYSAFKELYTDASFGMSSDGKSMLVLTKENILNIINMQNKQLEKKLILDLPTHMMKELKLYYDCTNNRIAVLVQGNRGGNSVYIFNSENGALLFKLGDFSSFDESYISSNGKYIITKKWNLTNGQKALNAWVIPNFEEIIRIAREELK